MIFDVQDHADEVAIIKPGHRARGAQTDDLELGRRLPRHAVPERAAVVEPVARPARLSDREPVVAAVAAPEVVCETHFSSSNFLRLPLLLYLVGSTLPSFPRAAFLCRRLKEKKPCVDPRSLM